MPVYKRQYASGTIGWYYKFQPPGAARGSLPIRGFGFATKKEAQEAEARRRIEEEKKREAARARIAAAVPDTLGALLQEFQLRHVEQNLAPKTIERYREMATYIDPALLAMPLAEITPLHLSREWQRLLKSGGHRRRPNTDDPAKLAAWAATASRPLSKKTVRNIAGLVSAAFGRAIKWGLVVANPVSNSEPPVPKKRIKVALPPSEQELLIESAGGPWCLPMFLEMSAATGARRGETLALRWSDLRDGVIFIERSLTQTKHILEFKSTKTDEPRCVVLPPSVLEHLEAHRRRQDEFRRQYGPDYRADLDLIFCNPDGTPLKPDSISAVVSTLCRRLGLPKGASLHALRHSHASLLLSDGVDLATVSERLGHSSVRTTADIYSHAIRGRDREAARRWDQAMQRQGAQQDRPKMVN